MKYKSHLESVSSAFFASILKFFVIVFCFVLAGFYFKVNVYAETASCVTTSFGTYCYYNGTISCVGGGTVNCSGQFIWCNNSGGATATCGGQHANTQCLLECGSGGGTGAPDVVEDYFHRVYFKRSDGSFKYLNSNQVGFRDPRIESECGRTINTAVFPNGKHASMYAWLGNDTIGDNRFINNSTISPTQSNPNPTFLVKFQENIAYAVNIKIFDSYYFVDNADWYTYGDQGGGLGTRVNYTYKSIDYPYRCVETGSCSGANCPSSDFCDRSSTIMDDYSAVKFQVKDCGDASDGGNSLFLYEVKKSIMGRVVGIDESAGSHVGLANIPVSIRAWKSGLADVNFTVWTDNQGYYRLNDPSISDREFYSVGLFPLPDGYHSTYDPNSVKTVDWRNPIAKNQAIGWSWHQGENRDMTAGSDNVYWQQGVGADNDCSGLQQGVVGRCWFGYYKYSESNPTTSTQPASFITANTVTLNGIVDNVGANATGGSAVLTKKGFYYGTSQTNVAGSYQSTGALSGVTTVDITTDLITGAFNSARTGLTPNTTYYFKSFVVNSNTDINKKFGYGQILSFTTGTAQSGPVVITSGATPTHNSATLNANITSSGLLLNGNTASLTSKGFLFGLSASAVDSATYDIPGTGVTRLELTTNLTTGNYSSTANSLSANATYYYKAYAKNNVPLTAYGDRGSFVTTVGASPPIIATNNVSNLSSASATLNATISSAGTKTSGPAVLVEKGYFYTTNATDINRTTLLQMVTLPAGMTRVSITNNLTIGAMPYTISGLNPSTRYYFRPYAINDNPATDLSKKQAFGASAQFMTNANTAPSCTLQYNMGTVASPVWVAYNTSRFEPLNTTLTFRLNCIDDQPISNLTYVWDTPTCGTYGVQSGNTIPYTTPNTYGVSCSNIGGYARDSFSGDSRPSQVTTVKTIYQALAPTVSTTNATTVGTTSAILNGNVTSVGATTTGSASLTSKGFFYGTNATNITNATVATQASDVDTIFVTPIGSTGTFASPDLQSLSPNVTYYFKAFATNNNTGGPNAYGSRLSFTTLSASTFPAVVTNQASPVGVNSASLRGTVASTGLNHNGTNASITEKGFLYGTQSSAVASATNTTPGSGVTKQTVTGATTGDYLYNLASGLVANTTYWYKSYVVTNNTDSSKRIAYGSLVSFATGNSSPTCNVKYNAGTSSAPNWQTYNNSLYWPAGSTIQFNLECTDPDNDSLTYNWSTSCGSISPSVQSQMVTYTVGVAGSACQLQGLAYDGKSNSNTSTSTINTRNNTATTIFLSPTTTGYSANNLNIPFAYTSRTINIYSRVCVGTCSVVAVGEGTVNYTVTASPVGSSPLTFGTNNQAVTNNITPTTTITIPANQPSGTYTIRANYNQVTTNPRFNNSVDTISIIIAPNLSQSPQVTANYSNVSTNNATLNGNITNQGSLADGTIAPISAKGFFYGINANLVSNATYGGVLPVGVNQLSLPANSLFNANAINMTPFTTYYFKAYVVNQNIQNNVGYSTVLNFTTLSVASAPVVTTKVPTGVSNISATLVGNISNRGLSANGQIAVLNEWGFVYGSDATQIANFTVSDFSNIPSGVIKTPVSTILGNDDFINPLNNLSAGTYYYRAYAINNNLATEPKIGLGDVESFNTLTLTCGAVRFGNPAQDLVNGTQFDINQVVGFLIDCKYTDTNGIEHTVPDTNYNWQVNPSDPCVLASQTNQSVNVTMPSTQSTNCTLRVTVNHPTNNTFTYSSPDYLIGTYSYNNNWFQGFDGGIYINGGIDFNNYQMPSTSTYADAYLIGNAVLSKYQDLPSATSLYAYVGKGSSMYNSGGLVQMATTTGNLSGDYGQLSKNYHIVDNLTVSKNANLFIPDYIQGVAGSAISGTYSTTNLPKVSKRTSSLTISSVTNYTLQDSIAYVFINGNLTINRNLSAPANKAVVFIVNGDVTISASVTSLRSIFILADDTITFTNSGANPINPLVVTGGIYGSTTEFNRDLTDTLLNKNIPAIRVLYDPNLLVNTATDGAVVPQVGISNVYWMIME